LTTLVTLPISKDASNLEQLCKSSSSRSRNDKLLAGVVSVPIDRSCMSLAGALEECPRGCVHTTHTCTIHTAVIRHPPSRLNKLESEVRPTLPTARSVASGQPSYYSDCGTVARSV